jgi:hypothetical protein
MSESLAQEMSKLSKFNDTDVEKNWFYLPYQQIDGVDVDARIVRNENGLSVYIIANAWIYGRKRLITCEIAVIKQHILFKKTYIKKEKYDSSDFTNVMEEIEKDINKMKFNKLDGVLYTPEIETPMKQAFVFNSDENTYHHLPIAENAEDCCVCLDSTKTITPCGHKLCVMCWGKVKLISKKVPCPYCRENLTQREAVEHLYKDEQLIGPDNYSDSEDEDESYGAEHGVEPTIDEFYGVRLQGRYNDLEEGEIDEYDEFPSVRMDTIYDFY